MYTHTNYLSINQICCFVKQLFKLIFHISIQYLYIEYLYHTYTRTYIYMSKGIISVRIKKLHLEKLMSTTDTINIEVQIS